MSSPAVGSNPQRGRHENQLAHGLSCLNASMNASEEYYLGPVGSCGDIPCAGFRSTPEGWVRPQGVGPRAIHHVCEQTVDDNIGQIADSILNQSFATSETV